MLIIADVIRNHKDFYDNRTLEEKKEGVSDVNVKLIGFGESSLMLSWWWGCGRQQAGAAGQDRQDVRSGTGVVGVRAEES